MKVLASRNVSCTRWGVSGSDTQSGYRGEGAVHPSEPAFARDKSTKNTNNEVYLALESLEPVLAGVIAGSSAADPVEMLETQLDVALDQLHVARLQLVKSRRRVGELQEVVTRLGEFLQAADSRAAKRRPALKDATGLSGLESHTA